MRFCIFSLLLTCIASPLLAAPPRIHDVRDHGAKGDGQTLDTPAIQAAIDACHQAGGGTVSLQGGVFLSGTIILRSNVTLDIAAGATLLGSPKSEDYQSITPEIIYLYRARFTKSLIYAEKAENISLTGRGTIDGQGKLFPARTGDDAKRPYLLRFSECRNVLVRDLTMRDSARWLSHYLGCENVTIDNITIHARIRANRDGMDIDSCDRVRISNCDIYSGDDAIVLKATAHRPCRRVAVTNCTLSSEAAALKLGTESQGGYEDITFDNCVVYDTNTAISLSEVDGGLCERINVSNIVMRSVAVPIFVRLGSRNTPIPGATTRPVARMRDVTIANVQAADVANFGCSITGLPDQPLENVTLQNIRIRYAGGATPADAARAVPEKEKSYPKGTMFGVLPAYGFYCRHVSGLRLQNIDLACEADDPRPAIIADDVADLDLSSLRATLSSAAGSLLRLNNVRQALIQNCRISPAIEKLESFLTLSGPRTARITLHNNDTTPAQKPVTQSPDVPPAALSTCPTR